jgi:hypothetical protein
VIVVAATVTDSVMRAIGVFPPWGQPMADSLHLLAIACRVIYSIAGSLEHDLTS